jgi:oxygen-dependent protoporphyrinogen oxidase
VKLAVIGGGVAGLAAAWELTGAEAAVTVFEPGRPGGKLLTTEFLGRPVDEGADAILTRVPEGVALCRELGLGDQLVAPVAKRALLWAGGRLCPFPDGLVLGAPARLGPLARSGVLSVPGMLRALGDLVLPRAPVADDESVFALVSARFGPEVADRLVEPLVGSIHAGSTHELSAAATTPQLLAAARSHRSLLAGLRRVTAPPAPKAGPHLPAPGPDGLPAGAIFVAPRRGMQALADQLVARLSARGAVFCSVRAAGLRADGRSVVVEPTGERFDGAVLATPAPAALALLRSLLGDDAPAQLGEIRAASVGLVTLGFAAGSVPAPADLSGVLVAPGTGMLMTACSFASNKWPHWAAPGTQVLRVSVGRAGDERWAALSDEALVDQLCLELGRAIGRPAGGRLVPLPGGWRVSRWPEAFPQYRVGHLDRVSAAHAALRRHAPMLALAGSSYEGVGVPACIASGRRAAKGLLRALGAHEGAPA